MVHLVYLHPFNCYYKLLLKCLSSKSAAEYDDHINYSVIVPAPQMWIFPRFTRLHLSALGITDQHFSPVSDILSTRHLNYNGEHDKHTNGKGRRQKIVRHVQQFLVLKLQGRLDQR